MARLLVGRTRYGIPCSQRAVRVVRLGHPRQVQLPRLRHFCVSVQLRKAANGVDAADAADANAQQSRDRAAAGPTVFVCSGGGMRGLAALGAVTELQKQGVLDSTRVFGGTSVGAIVAALLATKQDIHASFQKHILSYKYVPCIDITALDITFGLDTGSNLVRWLDRLFGHVTFSDIERLHGTTLVVCVTDINDKKPVYISHRTHPDMPVTLALRMSTAIPLYFAAVPMDGHLYVDGGVCDNFPVQHLTERYADNSGTRVLGIRLRSKPHPAEHRWTLSSFCSAIVECSTGNSTIPPGVLLLDIDTSSLEEGLNFRLPAEQMLDLYASGTDAARAFCLSNSSSDS